MRIDTQNLSFREALSLLVAHYLKKGWSRGAITGELRSTMYGTVGPQPYNYYAGWWC